MNIIFLLLIIFVIAPMFVLRIYFNWRRDFQYNSESNVGESEVEDRGVPSKLEEGYEKILEEKFPFYNTLDEKQKLLFRKRIEHFVAHRSFEGREGFVVTEESRILISAAAIRLTFGLNDYMLPGFYKILIYPKVFYSKFSKTFNRGETNPHGIIVFSWPHVVEGFETVTDHINLAYHEFAHALIVHESSTGVADAMFSHGFQMFNHALLKKQLSQRVHHDNLFRDYAFTNKMEFFAVSIEYFLESPEYLRDNCYELFDILKRTLRQDPITKQYGLKFQYDQDFWIHYSTDQDNTPF
jgi:MtfA peptidase